MNTTGRRYVSPVTPPPLVTRPPRVSPPAAQSPVVCLRCDEARTAERPLVSFGWGRVFPAGSRR